MEDVHHYYVSLLALHAGPAVEASQDAVPPAFSPVTCLLHLSGLTPVLWKRKRHGPSDHRERFAVSDVTTAHCATRGQVVATHNALSAAVALAAVLSLGPGRILSALQDD